MNRWQLKCSLQRDKGAGTQPENVVNSGFLKDCTLVLNFFLDAVVVAEWPAQTTAAAVLDIDGERVRTK